MTTKARQILPRDGVMKGKDKIQISGITRRDGETAIEFVEFLDYWQTSAIPSIYMAAGAFCEDRRYPAARTYKFFDFVHMYVHKVLCHAPRD